MPILQDAKQLSIHGGDFTDVQGDVIHYYGIQESSEQGILRLLKNIVVGASHDSRERYPPAKCLPGSYPAELQVESILQWVKADGQESSVLWVHGPANTEKSAIAQTVAESCAINMKLAASFFFFRERNSAEQFWATIAFQMAMSIPEFRSSVQGAVRGRPDVFSKAGVVQAEQLIVEPFVDALTNGVQPESRFLVIVDSLEECKRGEQDVVLDTIATIISTHNLPILFLITSRPELESRIRNSFSVCPVKHLNLLDPGIISTDLTSESATSASGEEEASYIKSLVFGNNNHVPPGGSIFDESGVFLTDALDLSHLNELGLWDMDIRTHIAMQEAVRTASDTIETFIWRFNLDAPPKFFTPDPVALVGMVNLRRIIIEMSVGQAGDPLPWLASSLAKFSGASANHFEVLVIVLVANRFSGIGSPDHISPYVRDYRVLTLFDSTLGTARFRNLRTVKIYVTGIDVTAGKADLRSDIQGLMPKLLAKGTLKVEILGKYSEGQDFKSIRHSLLQV